MLSGCEFEGKQGRGGLAEVVNDWRKSCGDIKRERLKVQRLLNTLK
jgi:hypothetical protein